MSGGVGFVIADAMTVPVGEATGLNVQGGGKTTVLEGATEVVFSSGMTVMLNPSKEGPTTTVTSLGVEVCKSAVASAVRSWGERLECSWSVWAVAVSVVVWGVW